MSSFIETQRLSLSVPTSADLLHWQAFFSNPEMVRHMPFQGSPEEYAKKSLDRAILGFQKHGFGIASIREKNTGCFMGRAGLFHFSHDETQEKIEIAYGLLPLYWGKGYATEILQEIKAWAAQNLSQFPLHALVHPENIASKRVLEKNGFAYLKNLVEDAVEYEMYDTHSCQ